MKTMINGKNFELTTRINNAPNDINGNKRFDIEVFVDGQAFTGKLKGYRKVKNGYRTAYASHGYNMQVMEDDILDKVVAELQPPTEVRSTHNSVATQIQDFIIENLSDDYGTNTAQQLESVVAAFHNWYGEYEKRRTPNVQTAFKEWLSGLPSELYITPYYYDMQQLMDKWLGKTMKVYEDDIMSRNFHGLIFREFQKLCRKYGVQDLYGRKQ